MENKTAPHWNAKHNWRHIVRELPSKRDAAERVCDFDEIYGLFDEAIVRAQASRCLNCPDPPCAKTCPLGNRIPEWLGLTADGRFLEAAELSSVIDAARKSIELNDIERRLATLEGKFK